MTMLLGTWRALLEERGGEGWSPLLPTDGGRLPDHWYRSDQGLWQDAGVTPAASDGDVVGRWEDLTANADHVNQANAGNKPTLQSGAGDLVNGHPVVRCDGIDDFLQGAFTTGGAMNQPYTMILVAKLDTVSVDDGNTRFVIDGDDAVNYFRVGQNGVVNPDAWYFTTGAQLVGNASDDDWNIWTILANGAASQFWINGISEAAGAAGANAIDGLTVGSKADGNNNWDGDVLDVLLYGAQLPGADMNQLGRYAAARYGLSYTNI